MRLIRLHRAAPVAEPQPPEVEFVQEEVPLPLLNATATFERDIGAPFQTLRVRVKADDDSFELVIVPKRDHRGDMKSARIEQTR